ncbi:MAG: rhomboid family intramembrane serine protease [Paracoccaceae bacterium]
MELVLSAADLDILGSDRWRGLAYQNGGFWNGLLAGWRPNYAVQPYLMFLSYAFLHSGIVHLLVNMVTLVSLGLMVLPRIGQLRFVLLYFASILGGAGGFALLSSSIQPMVGASGALFGLAGAIAAWEYVDRFAAKLRLWPVLRMVLFLIGLNFVIWWSTDGQVAWQTHLGGFVAGWIFALLIDPRSRPVDLDPE